MALKKLGETAIVVFLICCMLCSGCITENSNEEPSPPTTTAAPTTLPPTTTVVPTTAPPSAYTFPKYAYQLQEEIEEWGTACDAASADWQNALETLRALAESSDSTQDELYQALTEYDTAIRWYEHVLKRYYTALILSEHTEPTESGLLALRKESVPFERQDGMAYPYAALEMGMIEYMNLESNIRCCIEYSVSAQRLLDAIERTEEFLLDYHNVIIGYVYYEMNQYLTCLLQYSDGTVPMCSYSTYLVL